MTETGLRIRVDDTLRRDFIETCKLNDTTAAQVLRACMRTYLEQHGSAAHQGQLFGTTAGNAVGASKIAEARA